MTRDEIMGMDDRELYFNVAKFVGSTPPVSDPIYQARLRANYSVEFIGAALGLCYQAEEKVKEMGEWRKKWNHYSQELAWLIHPPTGEPFKCNADYAHAHPHHRAQAILLTINDPVTGKERV